MTRNKKTRDKNKRLSFFNRLVESVISPSAPAKILAVSVQTTAVPMSVVR